MTKEEDAKLKAARVKNPTAGRMTLVQLTGLGEKKVREWLKRNGGGRLGRASVTTASKPVEIKRVKTLSDFRNTYDKATIVPAKVKAAIKAMGQNGWEYEVEFGRMAGVRLSDLAAFRDMFADFVVGLKDNRRAWAGSVKTAKTMREML